jgi:predicted alpha/beta hydrolase family esterase
MTQPLLILPGIGNSGPDHWQTLWEQGHPAAQRVRARDWNRPVCLDWVAALEAAVEHSGPQAVLVAHSLACLQLAHWAVSTTRRIRAALLVAVPDPTGPSFPAQAVGFAPVPLQRLAFPSTVVASSDDPYGSISHARRCAKAWGSRWVEIGAAGHINASSGLGDWPQGKGLLDELMARQPCGPG